MEKDLSTEKPPTQMGRELVPGKNFKEVTTRGICAPKIATAPLVGALMVKIVIPERKKLHSLKTKKLPQGKTKTKKKQEVKQIKTSASRWPSWCPLMITKILEE